MDKRREKQLEKMKAKVESQQSPEEKLEQQKLTKRQLERVAIPMMKGKIEHLKEQINSGNITIKDEEYKDDTMPMFKVENQLALARLQLEDFEKALIDGTQLIKEGEEALKK